MVTGNSESPTGSLDKYFTFRERSSFDSFLCCLYLQRLYLGALEYCTFILYFVMETFKKSWRSFFIYQGSPKAWLYWNENHSQFVWAELLTADCWLLTADCWVGSIFWSVNCWLKRNERILGLAKLRAYIFSHKYITVYNNKYVDELFANITLGTSDSGNAPIHTQEALLWLWFIVQYSNCISSLICTMYNEMNDELVSMYRFV